MLTKKLKSWLEAGNTRYHSDQCLISSSLLSSHTKTIIHETTTLLGVLFIALKLGLWYWGQIMPRLRVFKNRQLGKIIGHKRDKVKRRTQNYITIDFVIHTPRQIGLSLGWSNHGGCRAGHFVCVGEMAKIQNLIEKLYRTKWKFIEKGPRLLEWPRH
jgi:hypothetical protein